ncbi:MAG: GDSL-type esterase/lipase family protein [Tannerella sp.]|jgi:lysophospholipase L1-like esterase|nr:GDSL-type esterase/lipase family protein [Tannerella sp.]
MATKDWLRDKKWNIIFIFSALAFAIGTICSGKVKATKNANISAVPDTGMVRRIPPVFDSIPSALPFINDSLCFIKDPANSMAKFIHELNDLFYGKDTVINIVHLGDSHIQAGYLSGRTMRLLQNSFGNAGRGWIAPFKLSKVNEPSDYFISSNIKEWTAGRCVQLKPKCPWGIGGIGIQTEAKEIDFNLTIAPNNGAGYSFNKVLLYRDCNAAPMSPADTHKDHASVLSWGSEPYENIIIDTFMTSALTNTFSIRSMTMQPDSLYAKKTGSNRYYGFMLMNGNPGILYHSIGVNGAKYADYANREYLRQLSLLKPSLLIVSLGTNESFGRNFSKTLFELQVDSFVRLVCEEIPGATLLITTPAETYKRIYKNKKRYYIRNENIAKIADVISSYTEKEGVACWDLYAIAGGDNSCKKWYDANLLRRDRIHFSRDGYDEQGVLLYKAIIRSCISEPHIPETAFVNAATVSEEEARYVE